MRPFDPGELPEMSVALLEAFRRVVREEVAELVA